jgi:hypothetical protein
VNNPAHDDLERHVQRAAWLALEELGYSNAQVRVQAEQALIAIIIWLPECSWQRLVWRWRGIQGFTRVESAVRRHVTMAPRHISMGCHCETKPLAHWLITVLLEAQ